MNQQDELMEACKIIGKHSGISLSFPEKSTSLEVFAHISETSDVLIRKILLKKDFWKKAALPLIAFHGEEKRVVAILPTLLGNSIMVDPATKKTSRITEKKAQEFADAAFSFSLPSLKSRKKYLFLPLLLTFFTALFSLLPLFTIQWIFNYGIEEENRTLLWQLSIAIMAFAFCGAFFIYLRNMLLLYLSGLVANEEEPLLWKRIFRFKLAFFRKQSENEIFQKLTNFNTSESGVNAQVFLSSSFSLVYLAAMFLFSPLFTLLSLPIFFLALTAIFFLLRKRERFRKERDAYQEKLSSLISESLIFLKRVRSSGLEKYIFNRGVKKLEEQWTSEAVVQKTTGHLKILYWFLPFFLFGIFFIPLIYNWHLPPLGNFFAFYLAFFYLCFAFKDLFTIFSREAPLNLILQGKVEKGGKDPGVLEGEISLKNVSFRYSETEPFLFESLSLSIAPKERIGIFGRSGSGKTTLLRLLLALDDPSSGKIFYDRKDLSELDLKLLRRQIGTVFRTDGILAATLYENIDLGRNCSMEQIEKAIDFAGFRKDLEGFSMGFNTFIPEGGDVLSSGQKQRLLLARAIAYNPSLLLLDQAFESIDPISQEEILERLKELPITQIIISHDLELLKKVTDKIYELDQGHINLKKE